MAQQPQIDQAIEGNHNVQLGVMHGNVYITQVFSHGSPPEHRERALALQGLALAPITASIATPAQPDLSLGFLALGAVLALLSAHTKGSAATSQQLATEPLPPEYERMKASLREASERRLALYGGHRVDGPK